MKRCFISVYIKGCRKPRCFIVYFFMCMKTRKFTLLENIEWFCPRFIWTRWWCTPWSSSLSWITSTGWARLAIRSASSASSSATGPQSRLPFILLQTFLSFFSIKRLSRKVTFSSCCLILLMRCFLLSGVFWILLTALPSPLTRMTRTGTSGTWTTSTWRTCITCSRRYRYRQLGSEPFRKEI